MDGQDCARGHGQTVCYDTRTDLLVHEASFLGIGTTLQETVRIIIDTRCSYSPALSIV